MDDGEATPAEDGDDFRALAEDWIAIWQSEITAFMTDPETQQAWGVMLALWAGAAQTMVQAMPAPAPPRRHKPPKAQTRDGASQSAGPVAPPGAASVDAAPVSRDDEIRRLEQRVAELERHLAEQDRQPRAAGEHRRPHRRSRSRG